MSAEIQRLLQPPSLAKSQEHALEFINEDFHSLSQLENHDTLERAVDDARRKADDLGAQLEKSQAATDDYIRRALIKTREHLASAQELSLARHALADELASLSAELESSLNREQHPKPTLLEELESLHRNLKELESVRSYVAIIEHALRLSEAAISQARQTLSALEAESFSPSTLDGYRQLQSFISTVSSTCAVVENPSQSQPYLPSANGESQPLKLVNFLVHIRDRTWRDIKGILSTKLLDVAEKMGWPQAIEYLTVPSQNRMQFESAFLDLIRLQNAGIEIHTSDPAWKHDGIYPIQALTTPIALRFKFHFEGKRDTNRLDKPEWYFTHILNVTHTHRSFIETHVQTLLSCTVHKHVNAFREFTLLLLPSLSRKLRRTIPSLLHHPSLLAHTIYQALAFDASVREQGFEIKGTSAASTPSVGTSGEWSGISDQILSNKEWFEAWVEGERTFAENQYNDIISSPDAWQLADEVDDEDSGSDLDWRPTNSARRVKALVEQITDRYQPLPRFAARTRFLIVIQIPILESYHSRVSASLDAFETLSSSFVRAVPGALAGQMGHGTDTHRLTSGVEGVERLIKAGLSAHYIAAEMERWGEDVFFLELWAEINSRAALRARVEAHPLLPDPLGDAVMETDVEAMSNGTIFQELVAQYRTLAGRAEDMIVRQVCSEVEAASKAYLLRQWDTSNNAPPDERGVSVPTTLVAPISLLSAHLEFLALLLPSSLTNALYRRIATSISAMLLQRRLLQCGVGRLSLPEANQLAEECLLWIQACRMTVGRVMRRIDGPWARLLGAMKLVTLGPDEFRIVVERIFNADAQGLETLKDDLEVSDMDLEDMKYFVRLRGECWR